MGVMHENHCTRTLLSPCKKNKWCFAVTSKIPAANLRRKLFANEKKVLQHWRSLCRSSSFRPEQLRRDQNIEPFFSVPCARSEWHRCAVRSDVSWDIPREKNGDAKWNVRGRNFGRSL